jgi:hypothetical protein
MQDFDDTTHPLVVALGVHGALMRELEWLRLASKTYGSAKYQRLVQYSEARMLHVIRTDYRIGCDGVRFALPPQKNVGTGSIEVRIAWTGGRASDVLGAWAQALNPMAKA